ncbi:MAG: hypothetical protein FWE83_06885 [Oscillospiraceae bacterium]|nr:hypothetical protein [Oscillospiraceae bacterium]
MRLVLKLEMSQIISKILNDIRKPLRDNLVLVKEKYMTKYFIINILAATLVLSLAASNSTTAYPNAESKDASETKFHNDFGVVDNNIMLSQSQSDVDEDNMYIPENGIIEGDMSEEEVVLDITVEPVSVLIHETSSIVPEGFEKYAVTYHIFNTGISGPSIAVIGGVHGRERAGQEAAQYLVDNFYFTSGSFLIIPKATATSPDSWGPGGQNLNRQFPGDSNGTAAQRVAAVITELLDDFKPCVIIDMHEAYQDGFSNKILFWPGHETTEEMLEAIRYVSDTINQTDLVGRHLGSYGGRSFGPARSKLVRGTTTREYTLRYNIPAYTTETCMSNRLSVRVEQKVFIINALFEFYQNKYDERIRMLEVREEMERMPKR